MMSVYLFRNGQGRYQLLNILSKYKHTCLRQFHNRRPSYPWKSGRKRFGKNELNKLSQTWTLNYSFFHSSNILCGDVGYKLKDTFKDCCSLLGVPQDCSVAELKEAYINKAKLYHPDSGTSTADPNKFDQVREAYQTVKVKLEEQAALAGLYPVEEEDVEEEELISTKMKPQHRQYLDNEGIGYGTRYERQKQYEQFRLSKAQNKVVDYKIRRLTPDGEDALVTKDKRAARRNKMSNSMDRMVEDLIQQAMSRGDFKDLAGAGKPLKYDQDTQYMDKITGKLNQILINEGTQPEWIMLHKEIRKDVEDCRQKLAVEIKRLGDPPHNREDLKHLNACKEQFHTTLEDINTRINKFNLICPVLSKQMVHYSFTRDYKKICRNPETYLPGDFSMQPAEKKIPNYQTMEHVSFSQILFDIMDIFKK